MQDRRYIQTVDQLYCTEIITGIFTNVCKINTWYGVHLQRAFEQKLRELEYLPFNHEEEKKKTDCFEKQYASCSVHMEAEY